MTRPTVPQPFAGIERIAVLRGGGLGDLVFALPAVEALAAAYPSADVVLLGMPLHAALLDGRPGTSVRAVHELPAVPGVRDAGGGDPDDFFAGVPPVDLAAQLHGGGRNANPFLLRLGASHTIGTRTEDAAALERTIPYRYYQHEVARWLEVAALAGAAPTDLEPRLGVTPEERAAGAELLPPGAVVLHPGATDPRRRWPAERFGALAAGLARRGTTVAVVGDAGEAALAAQVLAAAGLLLDEAERDRVVPLAGRLTIGELAGVLASAAVVVANDSGPRHLAQALGTATVGLFWVGNAVNAMPQTRARHRILLGWTTRCPVCGTDVTQVGWTAERCPHDPSYVSEVTVDAVAAEVDSLLGGAA